MPGHYTNLFWHLPSGKWAPKIHMPWPKFHLPWFFAPFFWKLFYKLTSIYTCIRQIYVFIEVWSYKFYFTKWNKWSNSLRAFIIFLILLCLFAFSLDGSSLHSIIGSCKPKPNCLCTILMSLSPHRKWVVRWHVVLRPKTTVPQCCLISLHDWPLNITLV